MTALLLFGALAIQYAASQSVTLTPSCNYAGTAAHYYPIGACVGNKEGSEYSSFKYVCNGAGNQVRKVEYKGTDTCDAGPSGSELVTGILEHFECNAGSCTYSDRCSIVGCADNGDCSECTNNPHNYDQHCIPWITDVCTGSYDVGIGGILVTDTCSNGLNSQNFYWGTNCDGDAIFTVDIANDQCVDDGFDNAYYTVSCGNIAPLPVGNGGAAIASDIIWDNHNNNNVVYNVSLLNLLLISTNLLTIMICLGICYKYTASKNKMQYEIADESESKSLNQL